jgi:hypothetical protein
MATEKQTTTYRIVRLHDGAQKCQSSKIGVLEVGGIVGDDALLIPAYRGGPPLIEEYEPVKPIVEQPDEFPPEKPKATKPKTAKPKKSE